MQSCNQVSNVRIFRYVLHLYEEWDKEWIKAIWRKTNLYKAYYHRNSPYYVINAITVIEGNMLNYTTYVPIEIEVGSEWLKNNLTDEEFADCVSDVLAR